MLSGEGCCLAEHQYVSKPHAALIAGSGISEVQVEVQSDLALNQLLSQQSQETAAQEASEDEWETVREGTFQCLMHHSAQKLQVLYDA